MLGQFRDELHRVKGFELTFEEIIVGGVKDQVAISVFFEADFLQRDGGRVMYWERASRTLVEKAGT